MSPFHCCDHIHPYWTFLFTYYQTACLPKNGNTLINRIHYLICVLLACPTDIVSGCLIKSVHSEFFLINILNNDSYSPWSNSLTHRKQLFPPPPTPVTQSQTQVCMCVYVCVCVCVWPPYLFLPNEGNVTEGSRSMFDLYERIITWDFQTNRKQHLEIGI